MEFRGRSRELELLNERLSLAGGVHAGDEFAGLPVDRRPHLVVDGVGDLLSLTGRRRAGCGTVARSDPRDCNQRCSAKSEQL
jgi:hypothetical protein